MKRSIRPVVQELEAHQDHVAMTSGTLLGPQCSPCNDAPDAAVATVVVGQEPSGRDPSWSQNGRRSSTVVVAPAASHGKETSEALRARVRYAIQSKTPTFRITL